jgi:hypothetical protein
MSASVLTATELAQIQADLSSNLLPDTCTILSVTETSDGQGGRTIAEGTVAADVACRLDFVVGKEIISGGAIQPNTRWMLNLPAGTAISNKYRFVHGGYTYAAVADPNTDASWASCVQVLVERMG